MSKNPQTRFPSFVFLKKPDYEIRIKRVDSPRMYGKPCKWAFAIYKHEWIKVNDNLDKYETSLVETCGYFKFKRRAEKEAMKRVELHKQNKSDRVCLSTTKKLRFTKPDPYEEYKLC